MKNYISSLDRFIKETLDHRTTFRKMSDEDRLYTYQFFANVPPNKTATMRGYLPISIYAFRYLKTRKDGSQVRGFVIVKPKSRGMVTLEYHTYDTRGGARR